MTEDSILASLRKRIPALPTASPVRIGIGDDAALYRPRPGRDLVFTTDMMHEGRHFLQSYPADAVGWKALARSLSDIAAMGAQPEFALLSLALGPWVKPRWVERFYDGFLDLSAQHHTPLVGGDLARATHTSLDVMVCGSLPKRSALRRDGARPGDRLFVSGQLGGGVLGLRSPRYRAARQRHLRPEPRVALGIALRKRGIPSAMMDLSDGLSTDLARLLSASSVSAVLDCPLPLFPRATEEDALHGGDDYELLFAAAPSVRVPRALLGVPLTPIGVVQAGKPGHLSRNHQTIVPRGWDHFRNPA